MKIKVKEIDYAVKPKQAEGKLVVGSLGFFVKPKQAEGKLLVLNGDFTVKPKPDGIKIYRVKNRSVVKTDNRSGAKIYRNQYSSVLKRDGRSGVRLYKTKNAHVLKQTCDGTIFSRDLTPNSVNWVGQGAVFGTETTNLQRITGVEIPIQLSIQWTGSATFSLTQWDENQVFMGNTNITVSPFTFTATPNRYYNFGAAGFGGTITASVRNASDGNALLDTFTLL